MDKNYLPGVTKGQNVFEVVRSQVNFQNRSGNVFDQNVTRIARIKKDNYKLWLRSNFIFLTISGCEIGNFEIVKTHLLRTNSFS